MIFRGAADRARFLQEAMPHMPAVYRAALGMTQRPEEAEDLVQETYQEAWKSFHGYQPGSNCKAWLFRILFRARRRRLESRNRLRVVGISEVPEEELALSSLPEFAVRQEEILTVLNSLPEHYRMVLVLADIEDLSYREIAQMVNAPIGTVMSRLNRARALFRQKLLQQEATSDTA